MKEIFEHLGVQLLDWKKEGDTTTLLIINNPDGRPRWICNAKSKTPLFLKFYLVDTFKSQLLALVIKTIFFLGFQKLLFKTQKVCYSTLKEHTKIIIDVSSDNWSVFTGTVGPNNKILVFEKTKTESNFYKIAYSEKGISLIDNEKTTIKKLAQIKPKSFVFPKVKKISRRIIKLEDISVSGTRASRFSIMHKKVLTEIYNKTGHSIALNDLQIIRQTYQQLNYLERIKDRRIPKGMVKKLRILIDTFDNKFIDVGMSHGDFTPWNIYVSNKKLAIYDWELSEDSLPIGFDAFHFIIQQGILVDRKPWSDIKNDIKDEITSKIFSEWSIQNSTTVDQYLKLYLLINTVSHLYLYAKQYKWHIQVQWLLKTWNEAISDALKENKSNRELMILDIFDFLNSKNYAAIKFPNRTPENLSLYSSIDLCIKKSEFKAFYSYLKTHPLIAKSSLVKRSFRASIQLFFNDGNFLSIDVLWQFKRRFLTLLNAEHIIKNTYTDSYGIKQMSLIDVVRFIGLLYGLNNTKIPLKYRAYQQLLADEESLLDELLYCNYLENTICKEALVKCLKKAKVNKGFNRIKNAFYYYVDSFRQFLSPKGMIITFSGVDGSGKSTVIEHIKSEIERKTSKKVVVLRHRPSLLPILSAWIKGKYKAEQDASTTLPRLGKNKNFSGSLLRFLYYYSDYLFGQFYIYIKYLSKGYVVLYDRYYFDFINDSKRSNICLPRSIVKAGYVFLIKPDLNFFLYADPDIILRRKHELDKPTIVALTKSYLELFDKLKENSNSRYFTIENNELNKTLGFIMSRANHKLTHVS